MGWLSRKGLGHPRLVRTTDHWQFSVLRQINPRKFRRYLLQAFVLAAVIVCAFVLINTTHENLTRQGMTSGLDFLNRSVGWGIAFSIIKYSPSDPYTRVFLIGFINTILVGVMCIALSTTFGTLIGIARLSNNNLLRQLAKLYVDVFRNIPLVLQAIFWYSLLTHLPPPRSALSIFDVAVISNRGLIIPSLNLSGKAASIALMVCAASLLAGLALRKVVFPGGTKAISYGLFLAVPAVALTLMVTLGRTEPSLFSVPALHGLRFLGGISFGPEFVALVVAITIFSSAYIAEIVRSGFLAVGKGTLEAAGSLGLRPLVILKKIHIPLALRAILPPLGNQYVYVMKATTIGIAIGFTDLFMVSATAINQTGQVIEIMAIMMGSFFVINFTLTRIVNLVNAKFRLKGY